MMKTLKKALLIIVVILAISLAGAYLFFKGKTYVVRIPEAEIQQKLDEKLPFAKSYFLLLQVTLDNPRVHLENGTDRINAGLDIVLNLKVDNNPKPLGGSVDVSGGVKYVASRGAFFLTEPEIEQLSIQGIPDKYLAKAEQAISQALAHYYEDNPIYTLRNTDLKQAAARLVLQEVVVENKTLVITLGI